MADKVHEERMALWDRLLQGDVPNAHVLEQVMARLIRSVGDEERDGCVLLLAAVHVYWSSRSSARRTLTAALRYWWSRTGSKARPAEFDHRKLDGAGVLEVMGLHLTWEEALRSVGVRKVDHKALHRVVEQLERAYGEVWQRVLGSKAPTPWTKDGGR